MYMMTRNEMCGILGMFTDLHTTAKSPRCSKHRRLKNQLKEECQTTLSFLGLYNFIATKIEVLNTDTNQYETFNLVGE